jgi:hypothetical protein
MPARPSTTPQDSADRVALLRRELRTQHRRYGIDSSPPEIADLELAVDRRRNRISHLRAQIAEMEEDVARLSAEIEGYAKGLVLLLGAELDRIRRRHGEGWSPTPVLGFRLWGFEGTHLYGARRTWPEPRLRARCATTTTNPDEVPHTDGRCGRLGCGVYATKEIEPLLDELVEPSARWYVAGLVELSGKVVEHERGYRAAAAEVVAVVAVGEADIDCSDDPEMIRRLFRHPRSILEVHTAVPTPGDGEIRRRTVRYLNDRREERGNPWTSANSSA